MENLKIVLVSSEPDFIAQTKNHLGKDYEIIVARSYFEGLEKAIQESPVLIIIGYLMPRGDSFLLHQKLRADINTKHIPLLIVDVRPEEHSRKGWRKSEGMQMQAEGYMSRPVEAFVLKEEIERCLAKVTLKQMELDRCIKAMEMAFSRQIEGFKQPKSSVINI